MDNFRESFVHVFKTIGKYYLYDVNTNKIIRINKNIYNFYMNKENADSNTLKALKQLFDYGLLRLNSIKNIRHNMTDFLPYYLSKKVQGVTLQVTQQCNLRCKYCVYSGKYATRGHNAKFMTFDVAKTAIDFLFAHSSDILEPSIGFYGGEPLLNFSLIKKVIRYAKYKYDGKNISFVITTNGTIFDDEILSFFNKENISIMISFDGPKELHDKNRIFASNGKGTYDTIIKNINYIKEKYPKIYKYIAYNAVIDPSNDLSCFNDFIVNFSDIDTERISPSVVADTMRIENDVIWPENFFIGSRYEDFLIFLSKLGRIQKRKIDSAMKTSFSQFKSIMYTTRNISHRLPESYHPAGPCIPGARKLFVDTDGNFYPCERVSEVSEHMIIGNTNEGFDLEKIERLLNVGKVTEEECKKCWGLRFCGQCCATADDTNELSKVVRLRGCKRSLIGAEEMLKNFCFLREHGYSFQNDGINIAQIEA